MPVLRLDHVQPVGISGLVPPRVAYNRDYDYISPAERLRLIKATGIEQRRFFGPGTLTSQAALPPCQALMGALGWAPHTVDALVLVTQMPDRTMPHTSARIQHMLGLSTDCVALDLNMGCSGFIYGLSVVAGLLQTGGLRRALLVFVNLSDVYASPRDPTVYPLFGDAAVALALEHNPQAEPLQVLMGTDGGGYDVIQVPAPLGARITGQDLQETEVRPGVWHAPVQLDMHGSKVFSFALREVAASIRRLLAATGQRLEAFDHVVLHQANGLLLRSIAKQLGLPQHRLPLSLDVYGNTNGASIPLTLLHTLQQEQPPLDLFLPDAEPPDFAALGQALAADVPQALRVLGAGFGVGLSWGVASFRLPEGFRYVPLFSYDARYIAPKVAACAVAS